MSDYNESKNSITSNAFQMLCGLCLILISVAVFTETSPPLPKLKSLSVTLLPPPAKPQNLPKPEIFIEHMKITRRNPRTPFHPIIYLAACKYQIDSALIKAVIRVESNYNPNAVSPKGAVGLMQLMPGTAKALGVKDSFNPQHNIFGGTKYLKQLLNKFDGNIEMALAAYNTGSRYVMNYNGVPPFPATRFYIQKVNRFYQFYKNQSINEI